MRLSLLLILFCSAMIACKNQAKESPVEKNTIVVVQNITVKDIPSINSSKQNLKFLDVRTPEETADGIIAGAIKIDYRADKFEDKLDKLNRDDSYIVYCRSGGRSSKTADIMKQMGFKSIYNLEGGYTAFAGKE